MAHALQPDQCRLKDAFHDLRPCESDLRLFIAVIGGVLPGVGALFQPAADCRIVSVPESDRDPHIHQFAQNYREITIVFHL